MKDFKKQHPPMMYKILGQPSKLKLETSGMGTLGTVIEDTPKFQREESNSQIEYDALDSGWRSTKMNRSNKDEMAHIEMK